MNIERGDKKMKINRQKYELARARACKGQKDLEADGSQKAHCAGLLAAEMQDQKQSARLLGRLALM